MALSAKPDALKQVPWFSLAEWHQTYRQIYSNDIAEQTKAYETLLVWKARIPKLPVGVECTLSIIQVCLRDREWTPKIDEAELPMYYENDLCLMYSTTIMRFLNQISNVGHTKQTSLFQIAKQLKIPEWIVNLRHDAAHGHELPSIGALRMAANVLLTWLHEEYWAAEAKAMKQRYEKSSELAEEEETCETKAFVTFMELWLAVGLYINSNYKSVRELPDQELRDMLMNLCKVLPDSPVRKEITTRCSGSSRKGSNYLLPDAQAVLFSEISMLIGKSKLIPNIEDIVVKLLFDSEAFFPSPEIIRAFLPKFDSQPVDFITSNNLPSGMTEFWQNFISLLNEKKLLDELIWRLIELVNSTNEDANRRHWASLWIKAICQALVKLKIAQGVKQTMEHSLDDHQRRMAAKQLSQKVRDEVNRTHGELSRAMWLNPASEIPAFLKDLDFVTELLVNANELTRKFVQPILDLVSPPINSKRKDCLMKLVRIHTNSNAAESLKQNHSACNEEQEEDRTYGVEDLVKVCGRAENEIAGRPEVKENGEIQRYFEQEIADVTVRNEKWEIASGDWDWASCAFGVLPWQMESLNVLEPAIAVQPKPKSTSNESTILPGFLDNKDLTTESRVNWDSVLRKKRRLKRKRQCGESDVILDRAIKIVKKTTTLKIK